jgi:AcrR family transcriptional regulator
MNSHTKHLSAEARRAITVETVVALAATHNPSEITTTAIARHLGVTQGALFKHFPSKDAILQAVMDWVAQRLLSRLDLAAQAASSPLAAIEAMFLAHVEFISEHPGVPRMLFGELQRSEDSVPKRMVQTVLQQYRQRLQHLFDTAKAQGELLPELDTSAAITLLIGMVQGLVMQSLLANDVQRIRSEAPKVFAIYRAGIGRQA